MRGRCGRISCQQNFDARRLVGGRAEAGSVAEKAVGLGLIPGPDRLRTTFRRSVTLPAPVAKQVQGIAKRRRLSDNRVLLELIELGIEISKQKERAFFELAERFRASDDPAEAKRLGDELGRMVFGQ